MMDHCGVEGIGAFCRADERIEHRNQNLRQISEAKCLRTFHRSFGEHRNHFVRQVL